MFILNDKNELIALKPSQFALEVDFQRQLEDHPELLAGELINPDVPRRWLLIGREVPISSETDGGGKLLVDHVFVDQDGVPTLVEVKRQTDVRLHRREVVAQMLDYAAHAVTDWRRVPSFQARFEGRCTEKGKDPEQELRAVLGEEIGSEDFWLQVNSNLEAQKIRLIVVADEIPPELRRVVEFLNRQMNPVDVLALELRQFSGENGLRTVVPSLYGQTEETRSAKPSRRNKSLEQRLHECENDAVKDYFDDNQVKTLPRNSRKDAVVYERNGTKRWYVKPFATHARVTQIGRFNGDESTWKKLTNRQFQL